MELSQAPGAFESLKVSSKTLIKTSAGAVVSPEVSFGGGPTSSSFTLYQQSSVLLRWFDKSIPLFLVPRSSDYGSGFTQSNSKTEATDFL